MNLTKIQENITLKTEYYSRKSEQIKEGTDFLLGFKDNIPVLCDINTTTMEIPKPKKKVVMVVVDPLSGEKYLNINGKKLKMVRESHVPPTAKSSSHVKIPPFSVKQPSVPNRLCVVNAYQAKGNSQLESSGNSNSKNKNQLESSSNYTENKTQLKSSSNNIKNNSQLRTSSNTTKNNTPTEEVIVNKTVLDKSTAEIKINDKNPSLNKASEGNSTDTHAKVTILNGKCFSESLKCLSAASKVSNNSSMEALNLTTSFSNGNSMKGLTINDSLTNKVRNQKTVGLQFSPTLVDCGVQTEVIPPSDAALLDPGMDLVRYIEESELDNDGSWINGVGKKPVISKEQKLFHEDLKSCLVPDRDGNLPIHVGVISNDVKKVKRMCIVLTARSIGINIENHNNFTPLQLAIITEGSIDIFRILLQYRPNLDDCDEEGNNILHLAVKFEREYILDEILQYAVHVGFNLNSFNFDGLTPLMLCCINGLHDCANILFRYLDKDGINIKDQKSGRTALFHAAECHDVRMVRLLLENQADTKIKNFFGTSPHDAMYELDDIPKEIKNLIFGKKRRAEDIPAPAPPKKPAPKKNLRMYSRLQKVTDIGVKKTVAPKCQ